MIATAPEPTTTECATPLERARTVLADRGRPDPIAHYRVSAADGSQVLDATTTALMDLYRSDLTSEVFEVLVELARPALWARVRGRLRSLGSTLDADEVLQDVLVNIYRYPHRFDGSRSGAFRAWSSTIVDNTIRRQLRGLRRGPDVRLRPIELLNNEADAHGRQPDMRAQTSEACRDAFEALKLVFALYLAAYEDLSERERYVLEMVEVHGMRYAPLAERIGIRPEALKMVVFRARRRIADRITRMIG